MASDSIVTKCIRGRTIPSKQSAEFNSEATEWLESCDLSHECRDFHTYEAGTGPTYVLDVLHEGGRSSCVRLIAVRDKHLQYAVLSYCWGGTQPSVTNKANVGAYFDSIDVISLPKTLQDANWVTRQLNLRYLWVDSLCIIQDDQDTKAHEIGNMYHTYSNAYIAISVDCGPHYDDGFLQEDENVESSFGNAHQGTRRAIGHGNFDEYP